MPKTAPGKARVQSWLSAQQLYKLRKSSSSSPRAAPEQLCLCSSKGETQSSKTRSRKPLLDGASSCLDNKSLALCLLCIAISTSCSTGRSVPAGSNSSTLGLGCMGWHREQLQDKPSHTMSKGREQEWPLPHCKLSIETNSEMLGHPYRSAVIYCPTSCCVAPTHVGTN